MDQKTFCSLFYSSHYLPIAYYEEGKLQCAAGFLNMDDPYPFVAPKLIGQKSPAVYVSSDSGYFGMVQGDKGFFIIGPAYGTAIGPDIIHAFMSKNAIPNSEEEEVAQFLKGLPQYSYNQFLHLLIFLHFTLTGESLDPETAFEIVKPQFKKQIGKKQAEKAYQDRDNGIVHGTYLFERRMLDMIQRGAVGELENYVLSAAKARPFREGKLADSPIRQAKNIFIGLVTIVGKEAAIPGGMDVEEVYQLIDTYTQEVERIQSVEMITNLQFNMLIDFASRVSQCRLPQGISPEVQNCMQYIALHINQTVTVDEVADSIGKSRAYICDKFKKETEMTIGQYVTLCKLREAKALLQYTDKPLSEISAYLAFSSQAYFQSVFKKHEGCTPMEFRQRKKQISE